MYSYCTWNSTILSAPSWSMSAYFHLLSSLAIISKVLLVPVVCVLSDIITPYTFFLYRFHGSFCTYGYFAFISVDILFTLNSHMKLNLVRLVYETYFSPDLCSWWPIPSQHLFWYDLCVSNVSSQITLQLSHCHPCPWKIFIKTFLLTVQFTLSIFSVMFPKGRVQKIKIANFRTLSKLALPLPPPRPFETC